MVILIFASVNGWLRAAPLTRWLFNQSGRAWATGANPELAHIGKDWLCAFQGSLHHLAGAKRQYHRF